MSAIAVDPALFARLAKRVAINGAGCWKFIGCITARGYGAIQLNGQKVGAHRAMWQSVNGPIPPGMLICHRCDVPDCINPVHLFLGTALDNNRDRAQKGRSHHPRGELNPWAKLTNAQVAQAMERYAGGERASQIAKSMNVSAATIHQWKAKLHIARRGHAGESNSHAKLNRGQVAEIRRLLANGEAQSALGRRYGVSGHSIWRIASGRGWQ